MGDQVKKTSPDERARGREGRFISHTKEALTQKKTCEKVKENTANTHIRALAFSLNEKVKKKKIYIHAASADVRPMCARRVLKNERGMRCRNGRSQTLEFERICT